MGKVLAARFSHPDGIIKGHVDLVHGLGKIFCRGGYFPAGGRYLGRGCGLLSNGGLQFPRRSGNFRGRSCDLDSRTVDLTDQGIQIVRHRLECAEQCSRFIS